jgi:hypothetical protein
MTQVYSALMYFFVGGCIGWTAYDVVQILSR